MKLEDAIKNLKDFLKEENKGKSLCTTYCKFKKEIQILLDEHKINQRKIEGKMSIVDTKKQTIE